ncbi:MAG: M48 family metallopeptidase [Fusobacteriota bacterium]
MDRAKKYNNTKLVFNIISIFLNLFLLYILGFSKLGNYIQDVAKNSTNNNMVNIILYSILTITLIFFANSILSFYTGYILEKKYDLSNEDIFGWLKKQLKTFLISLIFGVIIILAMHVILSKTKGDWWIYLFSFLVIFNLILGTLAPVIIFPIFYDFTDIENGELKEKILDLCKKGNLKIKGIFKFNMSKDTKKSNAAFTGLGKTKRVLLADNLLDKFTDREILSVFAHELGHFKKKHIWKMMIFSFIILLISLYLISSNINIENHSKYIIIFQIAFYLSILQNITMVLDNIYSRKNEYEADNYAKKMMGTGEELISALKKLKEENLADENPNAVAEFIFYSHPSITKRIKNLKGD